MAHNERQQQIFQLVQEKGKISVEHLAKTLFVSEMTVRRDLMQMEKEGLLKRYHGGAIANNEQELPISKRIYMDEAEKRILGKKAAHYLHDDISVFLDSSSTVLYIIPYIKTFQNITLITNSVKTLMMASRYHLPCTLIGGDYYAHDMCLLGPMAQQAAEKINVDVAFFSVLSLSDDGFITDRDPLPRQVLQIIMKYAKQSIFLFETMNLHRKSLYTLCHVDEVSAVLIPDEDKGK